jgi:hypothetical protein
MPKLKEKLLTKDWPKKYVLTEWEANYIQSLDVALKTSIYHDRLIGGMFNYISQTRLKLPLAPEGNYYKYEYDLDDDSHTLTITLAKSADLQ